jgi:uncharacterized protein YkwD
VRRASRIVLATAIVLAYACALAGAGAAFARQGKRTSSRHGRAHTPSRPLRHAAACPGRARAAVQAQSRCEGTSRHTKSKPVKPHARRKGADPSAPGEPSSAGGSGSGPAVIAAVLATPCEGTGVQPEPGNLAAARAAVLCLVNRERAEHGEEPLALNRKLQRAAEEHDQELIADDYFAHVSPSGETPAERISATGYIPGPSSGYVVGENLAWGTLGLATPAAIVEAWIASPGHLANILEGQYRDTGIAVVPETPPSLGGGEPGATYAQEFGVITG